MMRPYTWGLLFVLIAQSVLSNGLDPCVSHNKLDDPYRSTGYVAREGIDPMICDLNLKTGWYRFVNKVGGKMPETKVDRLHCGTIAPIWMRGAHPSTADGIVDRTACVNFKNLHNGCLPISIKVKHCNSSFFVYHLVAPFGCQMAYCAGTLRPCPRGQTGLYPNCTVSIKKDFPFGDVPVPKVTYLDDSETKVTLKCDFVVPTWGNVSFEIQWFVNGKGLGPIVCDDPNTSTCAHLGSTDYSLGSHIRCDIRAKYNTHPQNNWTRTKASEVLFAGIEILPHHLDVTECDATPANRIKIRPTLPIRGEDLTLRFGTWSNTEALLASQCIIQLKQGEVRNWTDISIQAVCDNNNQLFGSSAFTFAVTSTHDFWGFYESAPVTISKIENSVDICIATGDPHYTTFDGRYYDFYRPGDFVLYRNKERSFEIHTRLWHCWGVTCNCGVAIREKHDVIVLTTCTPDLVLAYGMPMKVLITSERRLTRGTKILVRHPGGYSEYEVRLPSGTVVKVKRYSWGNNVEMEAPKSDKTNTEGMCGNFDGEPNNDFNHGGDGQSYTDPDLFGESWRVIKSKSLFHTVPACDTEACDNSELNMDRCECTKNGGAMSIRCNLELMQFNGIGKQGFQDKTKEFEDSNRKRRDLVYSDDIIYLYDDEEPAENMFQTREKRAVNAKMSLENATEYCRQTILNTAAAKVCIELSGVNASNAIQSCAADLQFTGDLSWVESAFESLKSSCEFQAVKNFSAYDKDEEGNFVPPVIIAQNLCPNDCNFNGNCTNGSCICKEGFVADDCSMRYDEIPRLFRILNKGICDIRTRPCLKTIVFGENFMNSKNLTCHVKEFSVIPSKWIPSNRTKTLSGSKTDLFAMECSLPAPPIHLGNFDLEGSPAAGYIISVSNDKVHESLQALKFITYDSICQECNISHGCSLKERSCLIKSHCFAEGDPNPKDWCQQCNSSVSQARWTRRIINFPPNITTPNQRYALLGEDLQLQLEGEDPENRPFVISLMSGSPPDAKLTNNGLLLWKPASSIKNKFYFKATDECNASSTFEMTIEILTCPCTDKGTCKPDINHPRGSGMYYCECQPGYEGQKCENEINECLSHPCVYGTCLDMVNNYSCQCQPGYTGYNCNVEIDECQSSPCVHGTCTDMVNSFTCNCQSGFTGLRCEVNINDCPSSGCGNGTCIDLIQNYSCQCNVGFAGQHCNIIMRNCSKDSCFPGVRCIQKPNTISCDPCPSGFTGDGKICKDINDCLNVSCQNGGSCVDGFNNFTCSCSTGYSGVWCETDIDDCANITCDNNGSCADGVNSYSCVCQRGFTGKRCEQDIDHCLNHTCDNGGSCVDGVNSYSCDCPAGYSGIHCEADIDNCVSHACVNNGSCVDGINSYSCDCLVGFTGDHCQSDIDDCVNHACANGGSCVDGVNSYSCNCLVGYTGDHCQTTISSSTSMVTNSVTETRTISTSKTPPSSFSRNVITSSLNDALPFTSSNTFTSTSSNKQRESVSPTPSENTPVGVPPSITNVTPTQLPPSTTEQPETDVLRSSSSVTFTSVSSQQQRDSLLPTTSRKSPVRPSPTVTPTNVPTPTENTEIEHDFQIKILEDWNDDLKDTGSTVFKTLSSRLEQEIWKALSAQEDLIGVKVVSFSKGSVIAEFQLMFRQKGAAEDAFADLQKQISDGHLGSLRVDPASLKRISPGTEEPTKDDKQAMSFPVIIGISCGGLFVIALVSICMIRFCQRKKMSRQKMCGIGFMPSEESFPDREKYEMDNTKSEENIVHFEEVGIWAKPFDKKMNEAFC